MITLFNLSCDEKRTDAAFDSGPEMKELVFTTNLKNDSTAIARYKYLHSEAGLWPEINEANKAAGINSVKIYLQGRRLFMVVAVPKNADMELVDSLYAASNPEKLKAWAELTAEFQEAPPGAEPGQIWTPMELIYEYAPDSE